MCATIYGRVGVRAGVGLWESELGNVNLEQHARQDHVVRISGATVTSAATSNFHIL